MYTHSLNLARYTTFGIGGNALRIVTATSLRDLMQNEGALVLGYGSNVLVADGGVSNTVVINRFAPIKVVGDTVIAGSGVSLKKLCKTFYENSLGGIEWACGIPSTLGGSIVGNAGAYGSCIANVIRSVTVLRNGKIVRLSCEDCGFEYRRSNLCDDVVLFATLKGYYADKLKIANLTAKYTSLRLASQPKGLSAGSIFKADKKPAGYYIDKLGLKGLRVGGASISMRHANFIINDKSAKAVDVIKLIMLVKRKVYENFGIYLNEEIKYVGDF